MFCFRSLRYDSFIDLRRPFTTCIPTCKEQYSPRALHTLYLHEELGHQHLKSQDPTFTVAKAEVADIEAWRETTQTLNPKPLNPLNPKPQCMAIFENIASGAWIFYRSATSSRWFQGYKNHKAALFWHEPPSFLQNIRRLSDDSNIGASYYE